MAELMFKRGKQLNLPAVGIDGCFYLTTDTNRLYVGQGENNPPVLLNQTVQVVGSVSELPKSPPAVDNDFFYCVSENVLAVYRDGAWTQINTNTNDIVETSTITFGDGNVSEDKTKVNYTLTLKQQKYDLSGSAYEDSANLIPDLEATLTLKTEDISSIIPEAAQVGLNSKSSDNGVSIYTEGSGSNGNKIVTFVPGDNVDSIRINDNDEIEFNTHNTLYDISVIEGEDCATLHVEDSDSGQKDILFKAGTDLEVSTENLDTVTYTHKTYNTESKVISYTKTDLEPEDSLTILSGITLSNGHITKIDTADIKMPFDSHLVSGVTHNEEWKAILTDNSNGTWTINFSEEAADLETELKTYIDNGLAAANTALTFKGSISKPSDKDNIDVVEVGDVYMLSQDFGDSEHDYRVGDLFIAVSKSNKAGVLEKDDLDWVYIPAGNELIIDTLFSGVAAVTGVTGVTDATNNGKASFHIEAQKDSQGNISTPSNNETLSLIAGHGLEIVNNTIEGSKEKVATVRHKDVKTEVVSGEESNAFDIIAIDDIDYSDGHITKVSTKTYSVPTYDLSGNNNRIILKDSASSECGAITVTDDGKWIKAIVADNSITIEHDGPQPATTTEIATNDTNLTQEGNLNIISSVAYDSKGHVTAVGTSKLKMPEDTTYSMHLSADGSDKEIEIGSEGTNNPYIVLMDRYKNVEAKQFYANHSNLKIIGTNDRVEFNLEWGSF